MLTILCSDRAVAATTASTVMVVLVFVSIKKKIVSCTPPLTKAKPDSHMHVHTRAWTTIKVQSSNSEHMLAVKSHEWLAESYESSRLPEVGEVPHQPEHHIFPRCQFGKSNVVSHMLFTDHCLEHSELFVSVSNLHFPKMK